MSLAEESRCACVLGGLGFVTLISHLRHRRGRAPLLWETSLGPLVQCGQPAASCGGFRGGFGAGVSAAGRAEPAGKPAPAWGVLRSSRLRTKLTQPSVRQSRGHLRRLF